MKHLAEPIVVQTLVERTMSRSAASRHIEEVGGRPLKVFLPVAARTTGQTTVRSVAPRSGCVARRIAPTYVIVATSTNSIRGWGRCATEDSSHFLFSKERNRFLFQG